jgi:hypothetical protein
MIASSRSWRFLGHTTSNPAEANGNPLTPFAPTGGEQMLGEAADAEQAAAETETTALQDGAVLRRKI